MHRVDWVRSFVHRGLRETAGYADASGSAAAAAVPCDGDEVLIGVYENSPGQIDDAIGITDRGIHLHRGSGWRSLPYDQIAEAILPRKTEQPPFVAPHLNLRLRSGEIILLPVRGRTGEAGQFSDIYGMERFLRGMAWSLVRSAADASPLVAAGRLR